MWEDSRFEMTKTSITASQIVLSPKSGYATEARLPIIPIIRNREMLRDDCAAIKPKLGFEELRLLLQSYGEQRNSLMQTLPVKTGMAALVLLSVCCLLTEDLAGAAKSGYARVETSSENVDHAVDSSFTCAVVGDGRSPGTYRFTGTPPTLYELADRAGMLQGASRITLKVFSSTSDQFALHVYDRRRVDNHDMTLKTGDVVIAVPSNRQDVVRDNLEQQRKKAYVCLVGVSVEPVVLSMARSGATIDDLLEYLNQPKKLAASVRVIEASSQVHYKGRSRGSRLLTDGSVVVFNRKELDPSMLPHFWPPIEVTERTPIRERLAARRLSTATVQLKAPTEIEPEVAPPPPTIPKTITLSSKRFESSAIRKPKRSNRTPQAETEGERPTIDTDHSSATSSSTSDTLMTIGGMIALAGIAMLVVQHRRRTRKLRARMAARIETFAKSSLQVTNDSKSAFDLDVLPDLQTSGETAAHLAHPSDVVETIEGENQSEHLTRSDKPHDHDRAPVLVKSDSTKPETIEQSAANCPHPNSLMHRVLRQVQGKTQD